MFIKLLIQKHNSNQTTYVPGSLILNQITPRGSGVKSRVKGQYRRICRWRTKFSNVSNFEPDIIRSVPRTLQNMFRVEFFFL